MLTFVCILNKGKEAMGFDKIIDIFYLWLDPEERRKRKI